MSTYSCDSSAGTNVSTTSPASAPHPGHLPSLTLIRPTLRPRASAFVTPKSHFASPHRTHRAATTPGTLPPLSDGEARDLLDHVLSDLPDAGRTADAVSRPAHSCRNLPLALRIVGRPWTPFSVRMAGSHKPARAAPANPCQPCARPVAGWDCYVFEDSVASAHAAGQARPWGGGHAIAAGIRLEPAPGHTPCSSIFTLGFQGRPRRLRRRFPPGDRSWNHQAVSAACTPCAGGPPTAPSWPCTPAPDSVPSSTSRSCDRAVMPSLGNTR